MTRASRILEALRYGCWLSEATLMGRLKLGRTALRSDVATLVRLGLVKLAHAMPSCTGGKPMRMYLRVHPSEWRLPGRKRPATRRTAAGTTRRAAWA